MAPDPSTAPSLLGDVPVSIVGELVVLRPAGMPDLDKFYEWRIDLNDLHLWSLSHWVPAPDNFRVEFQQYFLANLTFVVATKASGEVAGFVQAYSHSLEHGWAFIMAYVDRRARAPGLALEALFLLADYLFKSFPIRKIYTEIYEYNRRSLGFLQKLGFQEEGSLKEHIWYDGRYWDFIRLSLSRDRWRSVAENLQPLFESMSKSSSMKRLRVE